MIRGLRILGTVTLWSLSIVMAIVAMRYFLGPASWIAGAGAHALERHRVFLLVHIAGGAVAITAGLAQFVASLRRSRPDVHRAAGYVYFAAVLSASLAGLWLSPDTAEFAADGLMDGKELDLTSFGFTAASLGYRPLDTYTPSRLPLVVPAFATLAILWLATSILAVNSARRRRFAEHREWMLRNYALTFAAVTVRLIAFPILILTRNPVLAITLTFWSWVLNLAAVEWWIRTSSKRKLT